MFELLGLEGLVNGFGWNVRTVGAVGILLFPALIFISPLKARLSKCHRWSGFVYSKPIVIVSFFFGVACVIYGTRMSLFPLIVFGVAWSIMYFCYCLVLFWWEGVQKLDWIVFGACCVACIVLMFVPFIHVVFFVFSLITVVRVMYFSVAVYRTKSYESLVVVAAFIFIIHDWFWLMYGGGVALWPIIACVILRFAGHLLALCFWVINVVRRSKKTA